MKSCLDALFEIALWYAISFKQRRYELAAFETSDMGLVKQYLSDEASKDGKTAAAGAAQDMFSNSIDPLQIDGDFSRQMVENQETDELKQDVFETDEEYAKRIAAMPKVHLGYAILDARRQDGYTKIVFPLHHIDRNDRIHFSNHIRAFYAEDITGHDVIDDELVCGLRVFDKQVYCNYSTIALKHGTEEIPMHPVCWEKFPYETERDLQDRIAHMPILPLGFCLPDRNSYDIHTQQLTFAVKPFAYVKEKLMSPSITLKFNRDVARKICTWNRPYKIFGQLKGDKASFLLWDKELGVFYDGLDAHDHKGKQTKEQPQDRAEMFAVLDGSIEELLQLGKKYLGGQGSQKDIRKGLECYKKAAEKGSLEAQLALGDRYRRGTEVEKDEQEAFRWYWQAAGQGNVDAQFWLGYAYDHGRGVEQDYKEAMKWYQKASEQGYDTDKELARVRGKISQAGTSQKESSGCFITTAVCQCFGKSDDCYEPTMFRRFRDDWLMKQPDGKALIAEYYATAPAIVSCIDGREHPADIYQQIWQRYLSPCLKHLEQGEYKACKERYIAMVCTLKAKYY